jgi:hypothetical protein
MTHVAYDPRITLRETIGTNRYDFDLEKEYYSLSVIDNDNRTVYIPIYLDEEVRSGDMPNLPLISLKMALTRYDPHNVSGTVRIMKSYVDVDIIFVNTDNIDVKDFGKKVRNVIQDKIRTYQQSMTGTFWMNLESERTITEQDARQVVFHYVLTLYCIKHDAC